MKTARTFLTAALLFALLACGKNAPQFEQAVSSLPRNLTPSVPAGDLTELVNGNTDFGLALYKAVRGDGNAMVSPYSVSLALAMTYAGARGETETQIADALHFTLPQPRLHPAFDALDLALRSRGQDAKGKDGNPFRLKIANASFGQKGFAFESDYLDTLAVNYGAGINLLDFYGAPEPSRKLINDWVAYETEDKILDLLPEGSIDATTRLVLVNAIYFNAAWKKAFDQGSTHAADFHRLDGSTVSAPAMVVNQAMRFVQNGTLQAVEIPYDGDEISMLVVAPVQGEFASFEDGLDANALKDVIDHLSNTEVRLTLPKFQFKSAMGLVDVLSAMGMPIAFTDQADFSGISQAARLAISEVVHQTFIAVDEAGTEAAAATGVVVGVTSVPSYVEMNVDRPFLFFIRDQQTGAILFAGRVVDPR